MQTTRVRPAQNVAVPRAKAPTALPRTLLLFSLAGQSYALPLAALQEIAPLAQLSRPPGMPALLAGFLNLRGVALPVVRLDRLFELPELTPSLYTPLLVLRHPDYRLALMADKVERIVTVPPTSVLPVPATQTFNDCTEGMVNLDGRIVLLIAAERILLEKEYQWLAEVQDREQRRLRAWEEATS